MSLVLDLNSCYGWFLSAAYSYCCWFELKPTSPSDDGLMSFSKMSTGLILQDKLPKNWFSFEVEVGFLHEIDNSLIFRHSTYLFKIRQR